MTPNWMKILYGLALASMLVGWSMQLPKRMKRSSSQQKLAKGPARLNALVPTLQLLTPTGEQVQRNQFKGKWIMLNFWATWCAPCIQEMPSMERLAKAMKKRRFVLLAASVDTNWRIVRNFFRNHPTLRQKALSMKILRDKDAVNAMRYGTVKYPETYLIDPQGRLRKKWIGPKKWDTPAMLTKLKQIIR